MKEPPRKAELPGKEKITVPATKLPEVVPTPKPPDPPKAEQELTIPAKTLGDAQQTAVGAIEGTNPSATLSQGTGTNGGAGTGPRRHWPGAGCRSGRGLRRWYRRRGLSAGERGRAAARAPGGPTELYGRRDAREGAGNGLGGGCRPLRWNRGRGSGGPIAGLDVRPRRRGAEGSEAVAFRAGHALWPGRGGPRDDRVDLHAALAPAARATPASDSPRANHHGHARAPVGEFAPPVSVLPLRALPIPRRYRRSQRTPVRRESIPMTPPPRLNAERFRE